MNDPARQGELLVRYLAQKKLIEEQDAGRVLRRLRDASCTADPRELLLQIRMLSLDQLIVAQLALNQHDAWSIPGYRIEARVGSGAMGMVFRAVREADGQVVALKLISERYLSKPDAVGRFQRELALARRISCRGFPWYGEDGRSRTGQHYYTMQLVQGEDLKQRLARTGGPISEEVGWKVLLQMAYVLEHLEGAGIIHRDIKPANILIDDELIWLCDLGLAKAADDETELTADDLVMGTPLYMSPEQSMGERKLSTKTDVYSLGVALYLCTTGKAPFEGATAVVVMRQHVERAPVPPRDVRPELSREWSDAVLAMLAKKPADRPTPARLAELVERAMHVRADAVMRPDATPSRPLDLAAIAAMPSLGTRRVGVSGKAARSGASSGGAVAREGTASRPTPTRDTTAAPATRGKTTARHRVGSVRRATLRPAHWVVAGGIAVGVAALVLLVTGVLDRAPDPVPTVHAPTPPLPRDPVPHPIPIPVATGSTVGPSSGSEGSGSGSHSGSGSGSGSGSAEVDVPRDWLSSVALVRRERSVGLALASADLAPHATWGGLAFDGRSLDRTATFEGLSSGVGGLRIDVDGGAHLPVRAAGLIELTAAWSAHSDRITDGPGMVVVAGTLLLELGHIDGASRTHRMWWIDGDRPVAPGFVVDLPIEYLDVADKPHALSVRVADGKVHATVTCEASRWELVLDGACGPGPVGFAARGKTGWVVLRALTLEAGTIEATDRARD